MVIKGSVASDRALADTRILDVAKGVLVALRGCSPSEAFCELVETAERDQLGVLTMSRALVELCVKDSGPNDDGAAATAARRAWGSLLAGP